MWRTPSFLLRTVIAQLCRARLSYSVARLANMIALIGPSAVTDLIGSAALRSILAASTVKLLGSQASVRPVRVGDRRTNERTDKQNDNAIA